MQVKVHARTNKALQVIIDHYRESYRRLNKVKLKAFGVEQALDVDEKVLTVSFKGLIAKILKKGGSFAGVKEQAKKDFLKDIDEKMLNADVPKNDYEVVFENEF